MADLNLRKVPDELIKALRIEAAETNATLRQVCIDWLGSTFHRGKGLNSAGAKNSTSVQKVEPVSEVVPRRGKVTIAREVAASVPGVKLASEVVAPAVGNCPACGEGLVPWGTSKRCLKCARNF